MEGSKKGNTPSPAPEGSDAWVPAEPGDQLIGEVVDVDTAWSTWREQNHPDGWYPLLTIRRDDGSEVKLHGFRTVLYNELVKREPIPGERIAVTYVGEGEAKEKGRNAPQIFRVRVDGRPPEAAKSVYRQLTGRRAPGQGRPDDAEAVEAPEPTEVVQPPF